MPPQEERDAGDGQKCLWCPIGVLPFYTYIRSCALLCATSAFAMLQTFGIPPRGSCSAPLHGGDGLRSSTFLIVWHSENVYKCSCEHGICSRFPRCFLHIRQEAAVLDIRVSAAVFFYEVKNCISHQKRARGKLLSADPLARFISFAVFIFALVS